jgi:ribosomal protein L16 Arg81 hydroxylase
LLAIVEPGDGLFIPRMCWHYVTSLQPSWSLSFWFD